MDIVPHNEHKDRANEYYQSVGHALSTWVQVEGWLTSVFTAAYDDTDYIGLRYAFSCIQSVEQKLNMITKALKPQPKSIDPKGDELRNQWKILKKKLLKANEFRNMLAHGIVWSHGLVDGTVVSFEPFPWDNDILRIEAAKIKIAKNEKPDIKIPYKNSISLDEIKKYQSDLARLHGKITGFSQLIFERRNLD